MRVILVQVAAAVVAGLAFLLLRGAASAAGALAGGLVVAIGTSVMALRLFGPALAGPGAMVARFAVGTLLKWVVVLVGFYLVLAYWRLPPLPALIGLIAALVVNLAALKFER